jgi:hypothetical protein
MIDTLLQNPAFQIIALVVSIVVIALNVAVAASILRSRKDNINEVSNRDQRAMDELRKLVEDLEKKDQP